MSFAANRKRVAAVASVLVIGALWWATSHGGRARTRGLEPGGRPAREHAALARDTGDAPSSSRDPLRSGNESGGEVVSKPRREVVLFGRVLDEDTLEPTAGARVGAPKSSTRCGLDGHYRLPGLVEDRDVTVHLRAPGFVARKLELRTGSQPEQRRDFRLERGSLRWARVFDAATGGPEAGATVEHSGDAARDQRSDAHGRFPLRVARGSQVDLRVISKGYCQTSWTWKVPSLGPLDPTTLHRLPLFEAATLLGRVLDEEGAPIAEVEVDALRGELPGSMRLMAGAERLELTLPGVVRIDLDKPRPCRTDADGRYALRVVPGPEPLMVRFRHDGYASEVRRELRLDVPGGRAPLDLRLNRGASIRGRVACNGVPWAGVVRCEQGREEAGSARVDDAGSFAIQGLRPGAATVYPWNDQGRVQAAAREITLTAGRELECDLAWTEARVTIAGRVVDPAGAPRAGVDVRATRAGSDGFRAWFTSSTRRDGTYELEVAPGPAYDVRAGGGSAGVLRAGVAAGELGVDFVVSELGRLRLHLVDANTGEAAQLFDPGSWSVSWRRPGEESFRALLPSPSDDGPRADGSLALRLPVGLVDLRLAFGADGYRRAELLSAAVEGEPGGSPRRVELERGVELELSVRAADPGTNLGDAEHVFFVLQEGEAGALREDVDAVGYLRIGRVGVWLADMGLLTRRVDLDEAGAVVLTGLAPGRYFLRAIPDDRAFEPAPFEVEGPGRTLVELTWRAR